MFLQHLLKIKRQLTGAFHIIIFLRSCDEKNAKQSLR
jgi:hypothetical protein